MTVPAAIRRLTGTKMNYDEAVLSAVSMEGRRFSPLLTARLRDGQIVEQLKGAFAEGRAEACRLLYDGEASGYLL